MFPGYLLREAGLSSSGGGAPLPRCCAISPAQRFATVTEERPPITNDSVLRLGEYRYVSRPGWTEILIRARI
jgi:hypothetical protein